MHQHKYIDIAVLPAHAHTHTFWISQFELEIRVGDSIKKPISKHFVLCCKLTNVKKKISKSKMSKIAYFYVAFEVRLTALHTPETHFWATHKNCR